jgi:hypothetical protein
VPRLIEQAQHAGFVGAHLAAEANHVGKHNRRQLASFSPTYLMVFHCAPLAVGAAAL